MAWDGGGFGCFRWVVLLRGWFGFGFGLVSVWFQFGFGLSWLWLIVACLVAVGWLVGWGLQGELAVFSSERTEKKGNDV